MNKFYAIAAAIVVIGLGAIFLSQVEIGDDQIKFYDLETKCQVSEQQEANFELKQDNSIRFDGHYPIDDTRADLSYSYTQREHLIRLEIEHEERDPPQDFEHRCLGSVVYDAQTDEIDPGTYFLEIYHDDDRVKRNIIQVR